MPVKTRILLTCCLGLLIGLGCGGGGKKAPAKVTGKVTYKNAPVTGGTISFHTSDTGVYSTSLTPEGTYTGIDWPAGEMIVTVDTESLNPATKKQDYVGGRGGGAPGGKAMKISPAPEGFQQAAKGTYVKIPSKYAKKDTSPLKATLKAGQQEVNFDLTD